MKIDLRSDTVTQPTEGMLDAMMTAEVGDDVLGDDPTVNALQEKVANLFGMESAIYCPSGTMTNQIAMRIHTRPQDEVICNEHSHVYLYEGGGMMSNSQLSPKLLAGDRGRIDSAQVRGCINPDDVHFPTSKLVVLENTMNKGGGSIYEMEEIKKIREACVQNNLILHLDGARLFNALEETKESPTTFGHVFDTISICFSKGLGAPVGSALVGSSASIKKARRVRKSFGGGMRQAGYLAAACIYALDNNLDRLKEDHDRARKIGRLLRVKSFVSDVHPVDTNIVIARLSDRSAQDFLGQLEKEQVFAVPFGSDLVRFVTHLDFTEDHLTYFEQALSQID